jgi:hypothetical protein
LTYDGAAWSSEALDMPSTDYVDVADVTGDGRDDIVGCSRRVGMLFVNDRVGGFERALVDRGIDACVSTLIADLDNEAPHQIMFGDYGSGATRVWHQ